MCACLCVCDVGWVCWVHCPWISLWLPFLSSCCVFVFIALSKSKYYFLLFLLGSGVYLRFTLYKYFIIIIIIIIIIMMLSKFAAHSDKVHRLLQVLRQIHSFSLSSAPGGHVWHLSVVGWAVSYRFKLTFCPSLPSYSFVSEWCAHDQKLHLNWTFIFYILCAIRVRFFFLYMYKDCWLLSLMSWQLCSRTDGDWMSCDDWTGNCMLNTGNMNESNLFTSYIS